MKKRVLCLAVIVFGIIHACSVDGKSDQRNLSDDNLDGRWKLIEKLEDPGDGSGTLQPVSDGRVLIINTLESSIQSDDGFCGTTEAVEVEITEEYFEINCNEHSFKWFYEYEEELLVIRPQCIEGCVYKYRKLE